MFHKIVNTLLHTSGPLATLSVGVAGYMEVIHGTLSIVLMMISIPAALITLLVNLRKWRNK
jgi:hypothetical protein